MQFAELDLNHDEQIKVITDAINNLSLSYVHLPLNSSIQFCAVSGGSVSLMCFKASSSNTSPVRLSFLYRTRLFSKLFRRIPVFSSSIRPLRPNSIIIHPRRPDEMQSFQNDV